MGVDGGWVEERRREKGERKGWCTEALRQRASGPLGHWGRLA